VREVARSTPLGSGALGTRREEASLDEALTARRETPVVGTVRPAEAALAHVMPAVGTGTSIDAAEEVLETLPMEMPTVGCLKENGANQIFAS
jgi:hypothetical protein